MTSSSSSSACASDFASAAARPSASASCCELHVLHVTAAEPRSNGSCSSALDDGVHGWLCGLGHDTCRHALWQLLELAYVSDGEDVRSAQLALRQPRGVHGGQLVDGSRRAAQAF